VRAEWQAHIDELLDTYAKQREKLKDLQERLEAVEATGEAAEGLVKVTVDRQGRLRKLELNPRLGRRLGMEELSEAILEASDAAAALVTQQVQDAMADLRPDDDAKPGLDLARLMADPPTSIEDVRKHYGLLPK